MVKRTYDLFSGKDLEIAELIQQRRLQMLVHSCLYYELDTNLISDKQWSDWAVELRDLQSEYPNIASQVIWASAFQDWDGTSGAFLPLRDAWVMQKAHKLKRLVQGIKLKPQIPKSKTQKSKSKALF